ncbi:hypothetical protein BHUM_02354c [Candidatus Burkholderia humilis]|nr:hypothetical protein BHUM_02354c [Candidatus Burkholderia humilis]
MDERKRDSIIAYLRARMTEFGITERALAEAPVVVASPPTFTKTNGVHAAQKPKQAMPQLPDLAHSAHGGESIFRNASGDTWDGCGDMPEWLKRAVHAGQDIDFYRV